MIVELCANDITRLTLGDDVEVGGVTVRLSMSLTESVANGVESLTPSTDVRARRREAKEALLGKTTPGAPEIFAMHAKYAGRCKECKVFLKPGGMIVYDRVNKRSLCMTCGQPVLDAFQRESATAV